MIIAYHFGLRCVTRDAAYTLQEAVENRHQEWDGRGLWLATDNGPLRARSPVRRFRIFNNIVCSFVFSVSLLFLPLILEGIFSHLGEIFLQEVCRALLKWRIFL